MSSLSSDLQFKANRKTVTASGTREALLSTGSIYDLRVRALRVRALTTNTGNVYIGDATITTTTFSDILAPGEVLSLSVDMDEWRAGKALNLAKIFLDVDTSGEGVSFSYVRD